MTGRLPLEPLAAAVRLERGADVDVRRVLGCSGETWLDALERGVTPWTADRWAIRAGWHPIEIWGSAWVALADDDDEDLDQLQLELDVEVVEHPAGVASWAAA